MCHGNEMTLERAVEVLNQRRHAGSDVWIAYCGTVAANSDDVLTEFEAIAIAEKYDREN